jgi:glycosyltransferase involved in cell wall biosynthesis
MRILYLTDSNVIGDAERYLATLAEAMARRGHNVFVLAPQEELVRWLRREAPSAHAARVFHDHYHHTSTPARRAGGLLALLPRLIQSLKWLAPNVVHVNTGGFPGPDLCRLTMPAARLAGIARRIMTVHSDPGSRVRLAGPRVETIADRLVWSSSDVVVSPSGVVLESLGGRRGMPSHTGRLIHYGVEAAPHDPRVTSGLRERLAPAGGLLVGMVSACAAPEKGYEVFLDALAQADSGVRGVIVGPLPKGVAERAERAGLRDRLAFEGARRNVGDYYAALDVLVVPSTAEECIPLSILEAASVGTPAFGPRLSGIPEAIADGISGRLFNPGSASQLAELIRDAQHHRARTSAMGIRARKRWLSEFRAERMVNCTLELYDGLASNVTQPLTPQRGWR